MILSVINNYSISKEEMDYVNLLVSNFPKIRELKDTIKSSSQAIINKLHEVYKQNHFRFRIFFFFSKLVKSFPAIHKVSLEFFL